MQKFSIRHTTVYRYLSPVTFGPHRMMLRPRDSHDLRLVDTRLVISPAANIHWVHDVFGNSIAIADFLAPSDELRIESQLFLERYPAHHQTPQLDPGCARYPFVYSPDERRDLGPMLECHYPDPQHELENWVRGFVAAPPTDTLALLNDINMGIRAQLAYAPRLEEGTQTPLETLSRGSGTCRDFALLMIEAVRALGFAARFVSGYLYDEGLDSSPEASMQGAGATHAWLEIYLPGAGWIEYDPTNSIVAGGELIRIAVTRDPSQAIPISGSFSDGVFTGMDVQVVVSSTRDAPAITPILADSTSP